MTLALTMVAFLQFGTLGMVAAVAELSLHNLHRWFSADAFAHGPVFKNEQPRRFCPSLSSGGGSGARWECSWPFRS